MMNYPQGNISRIEVHMTIRSRSPFWRRPATRLGRWAVILVLAFILIDITVSLLAEFLPDNETWRPAVIFVFGISSILCGASGGVIGLIAVIRHHERSWVVWLAMLPAVFLLMFLMGEIFMPH